MAYDGFTSYEAGCVLWTGHYQSGITYVHAQSEAIALQRIMAKFPGKTVLKIVR